MCNPKTLKSPSLDASEIVSHSFNNIQVMNAEADHDVSAGIVDYDPSTNASSATDGVDCAEMKNITDTDVTSDDSESSIHDTNDLDLDDLTSDDEEVLLITGDNHINHLEQLEEIRPLSNDTMMDKPVLDVVDNEMTKIARFICQFFTLLQLCYHVSDQALNFCFHFFVPSLPGLLTSFQMKM